MLNPVQVERLANGITIASQNFDHVQSVSVGLWFRAGARNERDDEHGMAHLLEHMAFKGTKKRSAEAIAADIENVGGEINAATSSESTSFFARVLEDDLELAVDILADIITDSAFDPAELEREKHVILQEIGAAHDTPDDVVFDYFTDRAFEKQTLGRPILGTPESVKSFSSDDIRKFIAREYFGDRLVVVAVGSVDHDALIKMVEQRLGGMAKTSNAITVTPALYSGGDIRETRKLMDAQILLGFEGRAHHARDFYASQILAMVLGGGMSSRLFQEVREKRGLCYSVYAFHWSFSDAGLFGVHAATGEGDIAELMDVIARELLKSAENIEQREVDRARAQFRAGLLMASESPMSRTGQIARQLLLHNRTIDTDEMMERIANITPLRLTDLAGRMFYESTPTLASVGPVSTLQDFETYAGGLKQGGTQKRTATLAAE